MLLQVRKYVIRRDIQPKVEGKKTFSKAPKIQRLVTPQRLQHKRHRIALKRRRAEAAKDAAVCFLLHLHRRCSKLTHLHRTSTPSFLPSVLPRRRASAPN